MASTENVTMKCEISFSPESKLLLESVIAKLDSIIAKQDSINVKTLPTPVHNPEARPVSGRSAGHPYLQPTPTTPEGENDK